MQPITMDLFYQYKFLSNLTASPSGDYAVFCQSTFDVPNNGYIQHLYTYKDGTVKQLTAASRESTFCFDDETHVVFLNGKTADRHSTELMKIDVNGGEALPLAKLPLAIGGLQVLNDQYYLAEATIDVTCHDYHAMSAEQQEAVRKEEKENEDYQILDEYPYCFNGAGFTNHQRNQLFLIDRKSFAVVPVCSQYMDVETFDVSPDAGKILYSGQDYVSFKGKWSQVYCYDVATGKTETVYDGATMQIQRAFWYQGEVIVAGTFAETYGAMENSKFYRCRDNAMTLWIDFDGGLYQSVGSDCRYGHGKAFLNYKGKPYFVSADNSAACLYTIENDQMVKVIGKEGTVDDFTVSDRGILVIGMYDSKLQEIYELTAEGLQCRTTLNDAVLADRFVSKPKRIVMKKQPFDIDGWVIEPIDYDPAKVYPAILDIHGGPKCLYGECFYHEMQVWASMGYLVFFCNPRGGDGKGNAFADLRHNYGGIDYEDLMDYTDYILKLYPNIDQQRVAVTGGSYGGYMTNWIVGHTNRFCCAATQRSISNWVTEVTASDYGIDFAVEQQFDDMYNCAKELWSYSPLKFANNVKTPLLFIHSFEDYRCPIDQGYQYYTALRCRGVETKMVLFKGENHELSRSGKPKHRLKRLQEITAWIEKYTK